MKNEVECARTMTPATSANLGPGFDSLGVALDLNGYLDVKRSPERGKDLRAWGKPYHGMSEAASNFFFHKARLRPFPYEWCMKLEGQSARGFGSSAVLRYGILAGLNIICGSPFDLEALYRMCETLESHADNASAAAFGGFVVARYHGAYARANVGEDLAFCALIPEKKINTQRSRSVLPAKILRRKAVENVANSNLVVAAFLTQNYELLRGSMRDHLHQPYRARLHPHLFPVIKAGEEAGAYGAYLSGSGSTIISLANKAKAEEVLKVMKENVAGKLDCEARILYAKNSGFDAKNLPVAEFGKFPRFYK